MVYTFGKSSADDKLCEMPDFSKESPAPWSKYSDIIKSVTIHSVAELTTVGAYAFESLVNLERAITPG